MKKIVYLVDLGKQHQPLQTMAAEWQGDDNSFFTLEFHASDDLKNWNYAGSAVFLKTADDGKTLIQNNVTLDNPTSARYLKVVPQENESGSFTLKHLNAVYITQSKRLNTHCIIRISIFYSVSRMTKTA